jgi:gluconate kinase
MFVKEVLDRYHQRKKLYFALDNLKTHFAVLLEKTTNTPSHTMQLKSYIEKLYHKLVFLLDSDYEHTGFGGHQSGG